MTHPYGPTYVGDYDDSCKACGLEQTVAVHNDKSTWFCHSCEQENEVNSVD